MSFSWSATSSNYADTRFTLISEGEGVSLTPYYDTANPPIPTIGLGFNLLVHHELVIKKIFYPEGGTSYIGQDSSFAGQIEDVLSGNYSSSAALMGALNAVMNARKNYWDNALLVDPLLTSPSTLRVNFSFQNTSEVEELYNVLVPGYDAQVSDWLAGIPDSNERAALLSLHYTGVLTGSNKLKAAIQAGNRAEAWYEIRYQSNGDDLPGQATRRYAESETFGLYNPGSLDEQQSIQIFQMVTKHAAIIEEYDQTYGAMIADPYNRFTITIKDLATSTQSAREFLEEIYSFEYSVQKVWVDFTENVDGTGAESDSLDFSDRTEDSIILGRGGSDVIKSGTGRDYIYGEAGNDHLYLSRGIDYLDGGLDSDTLIVSSDNVKNSEKGIQVGGVYNASSELDYAKDIEIFDIQVGGTYFKIEGLGNTYHLSSSATGSTVFNYSSYINGLDFDLADMTVTDVSISKSDIIAEKLTGSTFREAPITLIGTNKGDNYTLGALPYHNNDYIIYSGTEDDVFNDASGHVYYTGGDDSFFNYQGLTIYMPDDVEGGDISFTIGTSRLEGGNYIADVIATIAGHQTIILKDHITYSDQGGGYYWIISSKISPHFGIGVNPNYVMGSVNYTSGTYITSFDRSLTISPGQTPATDYHDFKGLDYFDASSAFWSVAYYGYEGDDVVVVGNIGRTIYGGSGNDKIILAGSLSQYKFNLLSSSFEIDSDLFTSGSVNAYGVEQFEFDDTIITTDILSASAQVTKTYAVIGGLQHLTYEGSQAAEIIYGKNASSEVDHINGGGGSDFLFGYDGDDFINGGTGADRLWGGGGADTFIVTELGALGEFDTIKDFSTLDGDRIDISALLTSFDHTQSLLSDFVNIQNVGSDTIISVDIDGSGSLHSSKQILLLEGITLSTSVLSLLYNGTLLVPNMEAGISYVYGTYLNDVSLNGSVNDDFISALSGNDVIYGSDGNDTIYAGHGDDDLYGGNGTDVLIGGAGEDEYWGGSSADKFVFTQDELLSSSYDKIWDYNPYDGDKIDISALWSNYNANNGIPENFIQITNSGGNTYLNFDYDGTGTAYSMTNVVAIMGVTAGTSAIGLLNAGYITVSNSHFGTNSNENMFGSVNNDIIFARDGNDYVEGGNGHDVIYGGAGHDYIAGGAGNDLLSGEQGNDTLWGGEGNDILYGLENSDRFFFNPTLANQGIDTIADFNALQYDWVDIVIPEFDPLTDAITDFVEITTSGSDSLLKVDLDGGADSFVQIAVLKGITGITDEQFLYNNGYLSVS